MISTDTSLLVNADNSQLIIIDVQTQLAKVMSDRKTLLKNCGILISAARLLQIPTSITEQYPKGIGTTEPALTETLAEQYQPVEKTCFSSCDADAFAARITQYPERNQLVICGIESHICVLQTAIDLLKTNKQVFIVADAVDSRAKKNKRIALRRLQQAGTIITCTESVIFEWLKDAKHTHFKTLSALIR